MAVKVIIRRRFRKDHDTEKAVFECIKDFRDQVPRQSGYISGEYLKLIDGDMEEILTISSWFSFEDWQTWYESENRRAIQANIDAIPGVTSEHAVYRYVKTR